MEHMHFRILNKQWSDLKILLSFLLIIFPANYRMQAQNEYDVIHNGDNYWLHHSDAPNSLYQYLAAQAYEFLDYRTGKIAGFHTISDWQRRQESVRKTLMDIVGPFPEKTPLNAKVLRILKKDGYRIEHIVYESQPGYYVTSSLFIPSGLKKKDRAPAVLYCSGHYPEAYRDKSGSCQNLILNLVNKGFIVFAFDPVGQGERIQYYSHETGSSIVGDPTKEHSYPGAQAFINGSSQARYMIWDGIRAVDYLISRDEVDPSRIGMTGCSGGGTQTAYIAAFDDRIKAAAPQCYITNFTRLLQSIGPQDAEQNLFHGIMREIDHADLLLVRAPKPALILSTTEDFFSIQGARETAQEVAGIYNAYDRQENFGIFEDMGPHGTTPKNREVMYAFFQKHLNNPGNAEEVEVELLTDEEMQVTSTGQIYTSLGGETVFSLNYKEAEKLVNRLENSRKDLKSHLPEVMKMAEKLSGYQEPEEIQEPVFTGRIQRDGYMIEKYFVKGEGDYVIPYLLMIPDTPNSKALVYLHPDGKSAGASTGGEMEWFVRNGFLVLAPDMIGIGEIGPGYFKVDSDFDHVSYGAWFSSILIGRSIIGIRAGDVVRLARLLEKNTGVEEIYALAREEMAPVLLHAAIFDTAITRIALVEPYCSYRSIVMNRFYNPHYIHSTVAGALRAYDLPDLASGFAPGKLMMIGTVDGTGKSTDPADINDDLSVIKAAYHFRNAGEQLNIISRESCEKPYDLYPDWIK